MNRADGDASSLLILTLALVALAIGVIVAWTSYGLCDEFMNGRDVRSSVCRSSGGGTRWAAVFLPPAAVLIVGMSTRRRRPLVWVCGAVFLASAALFVFLAVLAS